MVLLKEKVSYFHSQQIFSVWELFTEIWMEIHLLVASISPHNLYQTLRPTDCTKEEEQGSHFWAKWGYFVAYSCST